MGDDEFAAGLGDALNDATKEDEIKSVFTRGYTEFTGCTPELDAAIDELTHFVAVLRDMGVNNAEIDLSIARGLAYYTGLVFEFKLINHPELGTAAGGGRYADLAGKFSKTKIIGVGAAIGFSRIFVALLESGQIDLTRFDAPIQVAVLVMGDENLAYASSVLATLRDNDIASVSYLDTNKKFKNQIEYADKIGADYSVIVGENERMSGVVAVKNMRSGDQQIMNVNDLIKMLK